MTAKENTSVVALAPQAPETDVLDPRSGPGTELPPEARARIAAVAEGNPLFVEETIRMLVDEGALA